MILFLHNRYRTTGGEERVVEDLLWLVREHLAEDAELLTRDSAQLGRAGAARGLLRGGLAPADVTRAVRRTGARIVHAHNLNPSLGWRALAAARDAGARVVLHLHNYRLVCAVGTCFNSRGEDCTRCHGRDTLPGVRLNCRGAGAEAAVYAAALALHSRRLVAQADAVLVPSRAAEQRLRELGAPLDAAAGGVHVVPHVVRLDAGPPVRPADGSYALVASRLAREKGVDIAIDACARAKLPLVVAGDGPLAATLRAGAAAAAADVTFTGSVRPARLAELRASAALALVPSRSAETFSLAAAEAMAAGLPVAASRVGALQDLLPAEALAEPGDAPALAAVARRLYADDAVGAANRERIAALASPQRIAGRLRETYDLLR